MLKMKKYDRRVPFLEKDYIILKLSEFCVVAFAQLAKKNEKTIVTLRIWRTKILFNLA